MVIRPYLAMTEEEIARTACLPAKPALMCCPFSEPLPESLMPGSLLVLTDWDPADASVMDECISKILLLGCSGVLLDFQRTDSTDALTFGQGLLKGLSCPVVVSEPYAKQLDCPVFLPPVPPHIALADHIKTWKGREIWLDVSPAPEIITLTETGARIRALHRLAPGEAGHADERLFCHYSIALMENTAEFTLWRTEADLQELLAEAQTCGIKAAVGLYQELEYGDTMTSFR